MGKETDKIIIDPTTQAEIDKRGSETMGDIDEAIRLVLEEAPSDSGAELVVRRTRGGYKGLLTVYSRQGKFIGGSVGEKLTDVVKKIFAEVHDQIGEWKKHRLVQT
jgi:hypothetical protein